MRFLVRPCLASYLPSQLSSHYLCLYHPTEMNLDLAHSVEHWQTVEDLQ